MLRYAVVKARLVSSGLSWLRYRMAELTTEIFKQCLKGRKSRPSWDRLTYLSFGYKVGNSIAFVWIGIHRGL